MPNRKTAEDRKAELVEVTLRLADKVGPDRLSTEAIAAAVGVTQAAIFRHFPKKQDLWEAVAARIAGCFKRAGPKWSDSTPPASRSCAGSSWASSS